MGNETDAVKRLNQLFSETQDGNDSMREAIEAVEAMPEDVRAKKADTHDFLCFNTANNKQKSGKWSEAELVSINALIGFRSYQLGLKPEIVSHCVQCHFAAYTTADLHKLNYIEVLEFIVDHDIRQLIH